MYELPPDDVTKALGVLVALSFATLVIALAMFVGAPHGR